MLEAGECMLVFPEPRQLGDSIGEIFDGTAWLASKAGTPVVPVRIAGTEEAAMPSGSKFLKRVPVAVALGEVMEPPIGLEGRKPKSDLKFGPKN